MLRQAPTRKPGTEWAALVEWLVTRTAGGKVGLAARVGVTRQTIASWCKGEATPRGDARDALLNLYRSERRAVMASIPPEPGNFTPSN